MQFSRKPCHRTDRYFSKEETPSRTDISAIAGLGDWERIQKPQGGSKLLIYKLTVARVSANLNADGGTCFKFYHKVIFSQYAPVIFSQSIGTLQKSKKRRNSNIPNQMLSNGQAHLCTFYS